MKTALYRPELLQSLKKVVGAEIFGIETSILVRDLSFDWLGDASKENLKLCKAQGKYAGIVEDIHKSTVFVRLSIGVNAIAHSCYDSRSVGKKDHISFVVTHIDDERNVAVGIITRIIKQNI